MNAPPEFPSRETPVSDSGRKLFFGLFVFPLVIAVGMAILLCGVVLLTHENDTPEGLLASLKKSSPGKRWQKAYELSHELNRKPGAADPRLFQDMAQIIRDGEHYDAKTRGYMALALSHIRTPEAAAVLIEALGQKDEELRIYALWSLGQSGARQSARAVLPLLKDESPEVRKTAAYVLGVIGSEESVGPLRNSLSDPSVDVRWNASLSLARLGDDSGYEVLLAMLDRRTLQEQNALTESQLEAVMTNAMKGLALIRRTDSITILSDISKNDRNLKVRQAALNAIEYLKAPVKR